MEQNTVHKYNFRTWVQRPQKMGTYNVYFKIVYGDFNLMIIPCINRRIRENQQYALICITALFFVFLYMFR
jgi:hypothetical protein